MIFAISEGFKSTCFPLTRDFYVELTMDPEYWVNLGKSTVFMGHFLLDCLLRIHLDIIVVWNFYDPEKVSSNGQLLRTVV